VGECKGLSKFILHVHFEDFENMLDGKGSKINGQLYLIDKAKKLRWKDLFKMIPCKFKVFHL